MTYLMEALATLLANRLRTALSLAGLIVGVGAVIAIQILGHAMTGATTGIFQGFSNYTFLVYPNSRNGFSPQQAVSFAEVDQLQSIPNVRLAIAYLQPTLLARAGHNTAQVVVGPTGAQPEFFSQPLAQGRLISQAEVDDGARVCVLSANGAQQLAPAGEILGATIRAGSLPVASWASWRNRPAVRRTITSARTSICRTRPSSGTFFPSAGAPKSWS